MTTKHFIALAAEFAAVKDSCGTTEEEDMRRCLARRVASVCQSSNPAFDRVRFLKAVEVPNEP